MTATGITWTASAAVLIGALVRLAKSDRLPWTVPARWRPTAALLLGLVAAVVEAAAVGSPWPDAIVRGVSAAGLATLGHGVGIEGIRDGEELAAPTDPPRLTDSGALLVLMSALALPVTGCAALASLAQATSASAAVASLLDVAEAASARYHRRHPSYEREADVEAALYAARLALAAHDRAVAAGEDAAAQRAALLQSYAELRALLQSLGVLDGVPPAGGAETEAPLPGSVDLPPAAELERMW